MYMYVLKKLFNIAEQSINLTYTCIKAYYIFYINIDDVINQALV